MSPSGLPSKAYRLYRCRDGGWLRSPSPTTRRGPGGAPPSASPDCPPVSPSLRTDHGASQPSELLLESAFATRDVADWVRALRAARVPVEPVGQPDRAGFAAGFTQDPVNRAPLSVPITFTPPPALAADGPYDWTGFCGWYEPGS